MSSRFVNRAERRLIKFTFLSVSGTKQKIIALCRHGMRKMIRFCKITKHQSFHLRQLQYEAINVVFRPCTYNFLWKNYSQPLAMRQYCDFLISIAYGCLGTRFRPLRTYSYNYGLCTPVIFKVVAITTQAELGVANSKMLEGRLLLTGEGGYFEIERCIFAILTRNH